MAGSYPDAPFRRMAYDADGTIVWWARPDATNNNWSAINTTTIVEWTTTQKQNSNNEGAQFAVSWEHRPGDIGTRFFAWIFPEPRDIYGYYMFMRSTNGVGLDKVMQLQTSTDSTNGVSGTWTTHIVEEDLTANLWHAGSNYSNSTAYRIAIRNQYIPDVRVYRFIIYQVYGLARDPVRVDGSHIYGEIAAGQTPDRLLFIDELTGLEFDAPIDWGDVPRGTTLERDIRIRNNSSTLTAADNDLNFEALSGLSDTWHSIKDGGGSFGPTLNIASIAPGATYPAAGDPLTVRLMVAMDEQLSLQASRLRLFTNSWT
jgi:hypothetical protein